VTETFQVNFDLQGKRHGDYFIKMPQQRSFTRAGIASDNNLKLQ